MMVSKKCLNPMDAASLVVVSEEILRSWAVNLPHLGRNKSEVITR